jgi:hypothetical protein
MPPIHAWTNKLSMSYVWVQYRDKIMVGLFLLQLLVVYGLIQVFISNGLVPQTRWDQIIPLVPAFIIPYVLYSAACCAVLDGLQTG